MLTEAGAGRRRPAQAGLPGAGQSYLTTLEKGYIISWDINSRIKSARLTAVRFDRASPMQVFRERRECPPYELSVLASALRTVFIVACLVSLWERSLPQILILGCILANASGERCRGLQNLRSDKWRTR